MEAMEKKLDGCCTRMLSVVFNECWQDNVTKKLYGDLLPVSSKLDFRRLKLAGHCVG